jgi:hypothetical protein
MKAATSTRSGRGGSAIFSVLLVILISSLVLGTVVGAGMHRAFMARKLADRTKALAIAEAGANWAYSVLATNFSRRTSPSTFPLKSFHDGTFDANVRTVAVDRAVICSTGVCGSATEVVLLDVKNYGSGGSAGYDTNAFKYAICAGGEITWTGCATFTNAAKVHGNLTFKQSGSGELNAACYSSVRINLNGNSGAINGNCTAPIVDGKTSKISGTISRQAVPTVQIPNIDLTAYYNRALANGQVFTGPLTISSASTPPGGVLWVNGKLTLSGSGLLTGCFIATGELSMSGSGNHVTVGNMPAFISRDGDIKLTGGGDSRGLVYAPRGAIDIQGGGKRTGNFICGGNFSKGGSSSVFGYESSIPTPPGGGTGPTDVIGVSAWQK